jgi:hypothetical protein
MQHNKIARDTHFAFIDAAQPAPTDAFLMKSSLSKHSRAHVRTGKQLLRR